MSHGHHGLVEASGDSTRAREAAERGAPDATRQFGNLRGEGAISPTLRSGTGERPRRGTPMPCSTLDSSRGPGIRRDPSKDQSPIFRSVVYSGGVPWRLIGTSLCVTRGTATPELSLFGVTASAQLDLGLGSPHLRPRHAVFSGLGSVDKFRWLTREEATNNCHRAAQP
jgi:hypothetical protein